jgi:pyridoxamine 5'-phosphate oxidase
MGLPNQTTMEAVKPDSLELAHLREDYRRAVLDEAHCAPHPIRQFEQWFKEAKSADLKEPNAMTLATVNASGQPSARIVLLKGIERDGFIFYTNYASRKGRELAANPRCALTFYWAELERQVRVEGIVQKVPTQQSENYFKGRPKGSRMGAVVSNQSAELPSRQPLEARLAELELIYAETDNVPMPETWGGYHLTPHLLEFWQGRTNRLHDRIVYRLDANGTWRMGRLSP